ncbi:MAG: hypothetical protein IT337_12965 [Thermomicrobiales bacterium]|nr:hypothetical protein [Thermomicrobiales bacterium]
MEETVSRTRAFGPRSAAAAVLYGVLGWVIPLGVSFIVFPLKQAGDPAFETAMAVTLTATAALFGLLAVRQGIVRSARGGLAIGLLWLAINIALDLPLFLAGPFAMSLPAYLLDIGLTYLIFPIVTTAIALAAARR